jgi:hypothetical protein
MSNTYKDKPVGHRKGGYKKHHAKMMRDYHFVCHYGANCCGERSTMTSARTVEKRAWRKTEQVANFGN